MKTRPPGAPQERDLLAAVDSQRDWMRDLLLELMAAPTVLGSEEGGQRIVAAALAELGLDPQSVPLDATALRDHPLASPFDWDVSGKRVVAGHWRPSAAAGAGGRSLVLSGHVDVPDPQALELWSAPPFHPRVEDGRVVGWGGLKAGLVAMLGAVRALRCAGLEPGAELRLQSVVEEETGGNGTLAAALALPRLDGAVVAAALGECVPFAQVGVLWFTVRVVCPPVHAGDGAAVGAIEHALGLVPALHGLVAEMNASPPPLFRDVPEPIALNVGAIRGGTLASIGAGECELACRLALYPEQRLEDVRRAVEEAVAGAAAQQPALRAHPPRVLWRGLAGRGYELPRDAPIVAALARAIAARSGRPPQLAPLTTALDARTFHHLGVPVVSAGPKVDRLHGIDEAVAIDDLVASAQDVALLVAEWCGVRPSAAEAV
jgi:acetylornithine deacetylase